MPAAPMPHSALRAGFAALLLAAGLPACAPEQTASIYSPHAVGQVAGVSYGTVIGTRPVVIQGSPGGAGATVGALGGGVAGSFIGGDWRTSLLAGIGGAIIGGLAGGAIERGATTSRAVEFTVREDGRGDFQTVQTNEEGLQVGERVAIARSDRTRLSRAAGAPPAPRPAPIS
ncbi:glycine zipper 2TM domain-containing protein [Muricoccus radiodurans]|uniref:glycine zipper 2TM domain-containing protein n=1 Tax=Muricoccus radiodurans TaxID=2231721 RepID=UPI003CEC51EA